MYPEIKSLGMILCIKNTIRRDDIVYKKYNPLGWYYGSKILIYWKQALLKKGFIFEKVHMIKWPNYSSIFCRQPILMSATDHLVAAAFGGWLHSKMVNHVCSRDDKPAFSRPPVAPRKISAWETNWVAGGWVKWVNLGLFRSGIQSAGADLVNCRAALAKWRLLVCLWQPADGC